MLTVFILINQLSKWFACVVLLVLQEFVEDYNQFRERIADLDRRLASIVCQGFDDCPSTESALKVESSKARSFNRVFS